MPSTRILVESLVFRSPRVMQVEGLFDVPLSERTGEAWDVNLPLDERDWNVGLIVGPSGCGKSTIAHTLFGAAVCDGFAWHRDRSLLDGFPAMPIKEITELLSSVGFSSPPLWLRPFHVLSTGQQMRVNVARLLAESRDLAVMDEFTSVVDRTVAQIGSAAIAKTVRRRNQKFVAVTCHEDVADWLQPDWIYQPLANQFGWRSLQRRPPVELEIVRVHYSAWEMFKRYHYLAQNLNHSARVFAAFWQGEPVAIVAMLNQPTNNGQRIQRVSRVVCFPEYQGVGIGLALVSSVARAYRALGQRVTLMTSVVGLQTALRGCAKWRMTRKPSFVSSQGTGSTAGWRQATNRLTATFENVEPPFSKQDALSLVYG